MAENLKNLLFRADVRKTPAIVRAVECMDKFFEGDPSIITSGLRTPQDQINIIVEKAKRHKIEGEFYEFSVNMNKPANFALFVDGYKESLYWWSRTWSRLLNLGDIVNPPIPEEVLFDYVRPGSEENKKGTIIQISPHQRGIAFDIGGGQNLAEKVKRVLNAKESRECFISSFLEERVNNAIHVDVLQIG